MEMCLLANDPDYCYKFPKQPVNKLQFEVKAAQSSSSFTLCSCQIDDESEQLCWLLLVPSLWQTCLLKAPHRYSLWTQHTHCTDKINTTYSNYTHENNSWISIFLKESQFNVPNIILWHFYATGFWFIPANFLLLATKQGTFYFAFVEHIFVSMIAERIHTWSVHFYNSR